MLEQQREQHRIQQWAEHERRGLLLMEVLAVVLAGALGSLGYWLMMTCPSLPDWLPLPSWYPTFTRWVVGVVASIILFACALEFYNRHKEITRTVQDAAQEAFLARSAVREEIRWWAAHLELEFAWLITSDDEKRREWAVRRFKEVIIEWPLEHRRFEALQQREEFDVAVTEVGAPALRMLEIWKTRAALYQWARSNVTAVDRVLGSLDTQEEIARAKVERLESFEVYRKGKEDQGAIVGAVHEESER